MRAAALVAAPSAGMGAIAPAAVPLRRLVVGIGEYAVSDAAGDLIITHALGSCVAVCLHDPVGGVAGLIHVLLPESRINPQRAADQPAAFADTGIPLFVRTAETMGLVRKRTTVKLIGGAEITNTAGNSAMNIGRRNVIASKNLLWKLGLLLKAEAVGGTQARTVHLSVGSGLARITSGNLAVAEL